jgi:RNA polymerase I-specific transcription initiation factor RRN3
MRELVHQIFSFSVIVPTTTSTTTTTTATPEAPASSDSRFLLAVHAYCNFLIYLISANAEFLTAALRQLSQHLVYRAELHGDLDAFQDLIHATLLNICRCVPSASSALFPFLLDNYPHKSHPATAHKVYLKNLLRISEYAPELRDRILEAIVDRLIQIDVEVKAPSEAFSFDSEDNADMFALDDIDDEEDRRTAALPVSPHAQSNSKDMAEKLDALMQLMFEYLTIVRDGSEMLCDEVFASLLRTFDRSIVVTHKVLNFVHFLVALVVVSEPLLVSIFPPVQVYSIPHLLRL